jgi:methyl acetate hydrolase
VLTEVDEALARAVQTGAVPGVVALAADERGVLYEGAFGKRAIGQSAPMTLDSVFWIASMTKPVTVVAALQLVEQGRLALDQPLGRQLPELESVQVLDGFDAGGAPLLRPPRRPVTLRHLLSHTAGFGYTLWNAHLQRWTNSALRSGGEPLVFDPGERWHYGTNIDWVGRAVERVTGQSLDAYFRESIFGPLEMHDSGFFYATPWQRSRMVGRHQRRPDGGLEYVDAAAPESEPAFCNGGGGLWSTGPDYLRFLRMLVGRGELDGKRVLTSESADELARNQIGELNVEVLHSVATTQSHDIAFFPEMVTKWGFGGVVNTRETAAGRSPGSWAWAGLANTYFWLDPTRRLTGLILTQLLPFRDPQVLALFDHFETAMYALTSTTPRAAPA